jgi:hypothetical protein
MTEIDPHFREHDPILDANHCERCNAALRHTLILMADMDLGPKDAGMLAKRIREIALGLDPIEDVVAPKFAEYRDSVLFQDGDEQADLIDDEHFHEQDVMNAEMIDADIDIPLPPR